MSESIEQYRHIHESPTEWRLRKLFLEAHQEKFDEDRLLCLTSCFLNVEVYGSKYPDGVMEQLRELIEEIKPDIEKARAGSL